MLVNWLHLILPSLGNIREMFLPRRALQLSDYGKFIVKSYLTNRTVQIGEIRVSCAKYKTKKHLCVLVLNAELSNNSSKASANNSWGWSIHSEPGLFGFGIWVSKLKTFDFGDVNREMIGTLQWSVKPNKYNSVTFVLKFLWFLCSLFALSHECHRSKRRFTDLFWNCSRFTIFWVIGEFWNTQDTDEGLQRCFDHHLTFEDHCFFGKLFEHDFWNWIEWVENFLKTDRPLGIWQFGKVCCVRLFLKFSLLKLLKTVYKCCSLLF